MNKHAMPTAAPSAHREAVSARTVIWLSCCALRAEYPPLDLKHEGFIDLDQWGRADLHRDSQARAAHSTPAKRPRRDGAPVFEPAACGGMAPARAAIFSIFLASRLNRLSATQRERWRHLQNTLPDRAAV